MRDQSNALEAFLEYWQENNPSSNQYSGNMIAFDKIHIWAWDARPFPYFPVLTNLWKDSENYAKGHWLMGRVIGSDLRSIIEFILGENSNNLVFLANNQSIDGYIIENGESPKEILSNLTNLFGLKIRFDGNKIIIFETQKNIAKSITIDDILLAHDNSDYKYISDISSQINNIKFSFYNLENNYEVSQILLQNSIGTGVQKGANIDISSPIVLEYEEAKQMANLALLQAEAMMETLEFYTTYYVAISLNIGDKIDFLNLGQFIVEAIEFADFPKITLRRSPNYILKNINKKIPQIIANPIISTKPKIYILDLPFPFTHTTNPKPICFALANPWPSPLNIIKDDELIATINNCAILGKITHSIGPRIGSVKLNRNFNITLEFGKLNSSNHYAAIIYDNQIKDIIQFGSFIQIDENNYIIKDITCGYYGENNLDEIPQNADFLIIDTYDQEIEIAQQDIYNNIEYDAYFYDENESTIVENIFKSMTNCPFSVAHIKAKRIANKICISFIARNLGVNYQWEDDNYGQLNPQNFELEIFDNNQILKRKISISNNNYIYENEIEDFGQAQTNIDLRIRQIGPNGQMGRGEIISYAL